MDNKEYNYVYQVGNMYASQVEAQLHIFTLNDHATTHQTVRLQYFLEHLYLYLYPYISYFQSQLAFYLTMQANKFLIYS